MTSYPDTCRAAVLTEFGKPLEIREVTVPGTLEPGAILVKISMASVCASDVHVRAGHIPQITPARGPIILGHEMVGEIVAFGDGARLDSVGQPLQEGDAIVWSHSVCGACRPCTIDHQPVLCTNRKLYMAGSCEEYPYLTGGFAEYCYVYPGSGRIKIPAAVSHELASAASCALRTVVHGFDRLGRIENRETVLVQGTGPLGLFAVAMAHRAGASRVIAIGGPPRRLELARRLGATHTLDVTRMEAPERLEQALAWTGGRGADVVMEFSGAPSALPEGLSLVRRGGRYVVVGQVGRHEATIMPAQIVVNQVNLIGAVSANIEHYHKGLEFLETNAGNYPFDEMISNYYPFEQVNQALDSMEQLNEIKPAITFARS